MTEASVPAIDPAAYAAFINGLELQNIWLIAADLRNNVRLYRPEETRVIVRVVEGQLEGQDDSFSVRVSFEVEFRGRTDEIRLASINATFGLLYSTATLPDENFATVFLNRNMPVNVWPFAREFIASMTGRMGWDQFILPTLKMPAPDQAPGFRIAPPRNTGANEQPVPVDGEEQQGGP